MYRLGLAVSRDNGSIEHSTAWWLLLRSMCNGVKIIILMYETQYLDKPERTLVRIEAKLN